MAATEQEKLKEWLIESDAVALANMLIDISQIWDDLVDGDKDVSAQSINTMMRYALVEIPKNDFYRTHFSELHPVLEDRLYTWLDANKLEQIGDERDLHVSYIIRSVVTDLVIHLAFLAGGLTHRQKAAVEIRQMIYRGNEPFCEYLAEHSVEQGDQ